MRKGDFAFVTKVFDMFTVDIFELLLVSKLN